MVILAALAMVASACGSDSDDAGSSGSSSTASSSGSSSGSDSGSDSSSDSGSTSAAADSSDPIKLPIHNWSSQIAGVYAVGAMLESTGNSVEYISADSTLVYTSMCEGDMDLVHEVWQGAFGVAFEEQVDKGCVIDAATHDAKTREEWWYPSYLEDMCPGLPDWEALNACAEMFATPDSGGKGRFLGGPVDWLKGDQERVDGLGMDFIVENAGTAGALWAALETASANQEPIVLFNWTPNFIEAMYDGKFIEFPEYGEGCKTDPEWGINPETTHDCGNPKDGYLKLGVWSGFPDKWPTAYAAVQKMNFTNLDIAQLAMYVDIDGMEPEDAADKWLADNCDRWTGWTGAASSACPEAPVAPETLYDYGVTEDTIRVGAIADLSGIFAPLVIQIMDAQTAYWDMVNDHGGIDGKMVELVVLDNGYDVPTHLDRYESMRDKGSGVVFLSQSTGSPHTAAIAEMLVEDDLGAIPLSWYSGWPDPSFGQNVFESYTNYCYEAINAVDWLSANVVDGETKLAVISYPGEYGQDGATGAKIAAEALGIEVVYDGEGAAIPGADQTPVITGLIESGANLVWATVGPSVFAEIFGGAAAQGFTPIWSGSSPTYNYMLLATPLAPALDAYYYQSAYALTWNAGDAPGMKTMVAELQARMPDKPLSDVYTYGWTEAMATHQILETAAKNGDMTRAGVVRAANETVIDYQGLAPDQSYGGEINDFIVRESYLFDIQADLFDVAATVADGGSTGSVMLAGGPIMSDITRDHVYEEACFSAG